MDSVTVLSVSEGEFSTYGLESAPHFVSSSHTTTVSFPLASNNNFCCCFLNRKSTDECEQVRVKAAFWNLPALYLFCWTPLESKSPGSCLLFPAGQRQLLFWKERVWTVVILSNLKKAQALSYSNALSDDLLFIYIYKVYSCINRKNRR